MGMRAIIGMMMRQREHRLAEEARATRLFRDKHGKHDDIYCGMEYSIRAEETAARQIEAERVHSEYGGFSEYLFGDTGSGDDGVYGYSDW